MQDQQPGGLFRPGQPPAAAPEPVTAAPTPAPAAPVQEPPTQPAIPESESIDPDVTWSASEFIEREKPAGWYALVLIGSVIFIGGVYFLTKDLISVALLSVLAVAFLVLAKRKPRVMQYAINNQSIQVGQRAFPMGQFKSFAIVDEGPIHSIMVLPLKRFMPPLNIYFAPDDERHIAEILGSYLPQEVRKQDAVDRLMSKIHF